jgi:hypothetical protein
MPTKKSRKFCIGRGLSTDHGPGHIWTRAVDFGHLEKCPTPDPLREDGQPDVGCPGACYRHSAEVAGH